MTDTGIETTVTIHNDRGLYKVSVLATGPNGSTTKTFEFDTFPMEFEGMIQETVTEYHLLDSKE